MTLLVPAIAIFILGNLYRAIRILRMPAHLRWELYPLPHGPRARQSYGGSYFEDSEWWTRPAETSRAGELRYMLEEVLFLKGVWKNFRALWLWSWLLHIGLYSLVAATALGVLMQFTASTTDTRGWAMAALRALSWAAMCAGLAGTLGLIVLRASTPRLRPYSSRGVFLNLAASGKMGPIGSRSGAAMRPAARLTLSALVLAMLAACGAPSSHDEASALDEDEARARGRDTDETVFDDMIQTQDRARAVEDVTMSQKAAMDAAIDQAAEGDGPSDDH